VKAVILHIGLHKTGTSSVHIGLSKNQDFLKKNGILHPHFSYNEFEYINHATIFSILYHYNDTTISNKLKEHFGIEGKESVDTVLRGFEDTLKNSLNTDCDFILFSSGDLSVFDSSTIENIKSNIEDWADDEVKFEIICFVRNPISRCSSQIQQDVKNKWSIRKSIDNFITNRSMSCVLKKYENIFGKKNIKVVSFEEMVSKKQDASKFLLSKITDQLDFQQWSELDEVKNASLSNNAVELLCFANSHNVELSYHDLMTLGKDKFSLSLKNKIKIKEKLYDDCIWLKNNYNIDYTNLDIMETEALSWDDESIKNLDNLIDSVDKLNLEQITLLKKFKLKLARSG